jgi:phosphohistidine phosphatase
MELFILRHGIAVEPGTPGYSIDAKRPLTAKGERKVSRITDAMKELELSFDLILSSPYLRARQTAEVVADEFGHKKLALSECLAPDGSLRELVEFLNHLKPKPESILLVGHEPYLSEMISLLVSGSSSFGVIMKKAGLCKLRVETLKPARCASLEWLLTPKQMEMMS